MGYAMEWPVFTVTRASPKGAWYCLYRLADGRRVFRSTGKRNKREAEIVCQALQQTEDEAASGDLTKDRVTEIVNETLRRVKARRSQPDKDPSSYHS